MKVSIWSDVVCPWCYIGKRRFEDALARFEHRDRVEVVWRSFELDPHAPAIREGDSVARLANKYGMTRAQAEKAQANLTKIAAAEGVTFRFDKAQSGNTFDAHRLLHLAADHGRQDALKECLLEAYFTSGEPIGDRDTLVRLAADAGLDAHEAKSVLDSGEYAEQVRADEAEAVALGISGVPYFNIGGKYAVAGAQSAELLLEALEMGWRASEQLTVLTDTTSGNTACEGDTCAI